MTRRAERVLDVATSRGPARVQLHPPTGRPVSLLVLGHGAGGDTTAPDLLAVRDAALAAGVTVALVTQPYRVAGRRSPAPAAHLDEAWRDTVLALRTGPTARLKLVLGGRSSGARVACRTAGELGAVGVLALAFPLHPPGRPEVSREAELPTDLPTLVINGDRDPFGVPPPSAAVEVAVRPGDRHDLRRDPAAVGQLTVQWLRQHHWAR